MNVLLVYKNRRLFKNRARSETVNLILSGLKKGCDLISDNVLVKGERAYRRPLKQAFRMLKRARQVALAKNGIDYYFTSSAAEVARADVTIN